jgi:1,4-alpha-glucan branching enzyme
MKRAFTSVLHSHLPYVHKAGRWPHGETMVHEAIAETYTPLLNALFDLKNERYEPCLRIGLTPIAVEHHLTLPPFGGCAKQTVVGGVVENGKEAFAR